MFSACPQFTHWDIFERITDWSAWLAEEDECHRLEIARRNIDKNLPLWIRCFRRTLGADQKVE